MTRLKSFLVLAGLSLAVSGGVLAEEPEDIRDASGRLIESVEEDGTRVQYIYDQQGALLEARYSDGRVVPYEPEPEN
jgi:YD repeat-containing protein